MKTFIFHFLASFSVIFFCKKLRCAVAGAVALNSRSSSNVTSSKSREVGQLCTHIRARQALETWTGRPKRDRQTPYVYRQRHSPFGVCGSRTCFGPVVNFVVPNQEDTMRWVYLKFFLRLICNEFLPTDDISASLEVKQRDTHLKNNGKEFSTWGQGAVWQFFFRGDSAGYCIVELYIVESFFTNYRVLGLINFRPS